MTLYVRGVKVHLAGLYTRLAPLKMSLYEDDECLGSAWQLIRSLHMQNRLGIYIYDIMHTIFIVKTYLVVHDLSSVDVLFDHLQTSASHYCTGY